MQVATPTIDHSIVKTLYPLSLVADHLIDNLLDHIDTNTPTAGSTILKESSVSDERIHYLVEGVIELRISFGNRIDIDCSDSRCTNSLESLLKQGGSIKARNGCVVACVNSDDVDKLISQSQEVETVSINDFNSRALEEELIDDSIQNDWSETFLHSILAENIPASKIMQLFHQLEDIEVQSGELIIKENTQGDYFYIIKQGIAQVATDYRGPYKGEKFYLYPGNYFGDEALVADTVRNASVIMEESGVLGRLDIESFNELVKTSLVKMLPIDDVNTAPKNQRCLLDVRSQAEFRHGHEEGANNYPISYIRKHLDTFDRSSHYVIAAKYGRRSELAAYLIRQAGYEVFLLD